MSSTTPCLLLVHAGVNKPAALPVTAGRDGVKASHKHEELIAGHRARGEQPRALGLGEPGNEEEPESTERAGDLGAPGVRGSEAQKVNLVAPIPEPETWGCCPAFSEGYTWPDSGNRSRN